MGMSGGGGSQSTQNTVQTVKIPDYLQSAGLDAISRATAMQPDAQPYQPYTGEEIAGLTPAQNQGIGSGESVAGSPVWGQMFGQAISNTGNVQGAVDPLYGGAAGIESGAAAAAPNLAVNPNDIQPWMSQYVAQALQPQITAIQRQGDTTQKGINAASVGAGAFGDARTGIQAGVANRGTQENISNAVGTGYQSAFDRAVSAAQQAAAQRQTGNAQAIQAGSALSGIASQQGATDLAANQQIAAMTGQDYALQTQQANDLLTYGGKQQTQQQAQDSQEYQDFVNQREYSSEQLNKLLAAIQGQPYSTTRETTTPYNATAANLGMLSSVLGIGGKLASSAT